MTGQEKDHCPTCPTSVGFRTGPEGEASTPEALITCQMLVANEATGAGSEVTMARLEISAIGRGKALCRLSRPPQRLCEREGDREAKTTTAFARIRPRGVRADLKMAHDHRAANLPSVRLQTDSPQLLKWTTNGVLE